MKLIIDIPEKAYKRIQSLSNADYFGHDICGNSMRRIANGTQYEERPHGEWILVSDRLPEEDGQFLVFLPDRNGTFMCADFLGGKWYPDDYECTSNHVIAWMPLPEPYKKEGGAE